MRVSQPVLNNSENQRSELIQQRMIAAHQVGDALRSLGRYAEAGTYYRDVSQIMPRNIRNLADLAKTYCLSENWQRAEEYLWREVFKHDVAVWDADVTIHMAWTLLGGIFDHQTTGAKQLLDRILQVNLSTDKLNSSSQSGNGRSIQAKQWLGEAVEFLDFALHQRPRYLEAWRQSNWVDAFENDFQLLLLPNHKWGLFGAHFWDWFNRDERQQFGNDNALLPTAQFTFEDPQLSMYRVWIGLRMRSYNRRSYWEESTNEFLRKVKQDAKLKKFHWIQSALILLREKNGRIGSDKSWY